MAALIPLFAFAAVVTVMYVELRVSQRHERYLRASGAHEPPGDVYPAMRIVYPASFAAMAIEGLILSAPRTSAMVAELSGLAPSMRMLTIAGLVILVGAKALKTWAIVSLGTAWTFRVLVLPGTRLVTSGPYRYLRHPNYLAIVGELVGMALLVHAPVTGAGSLLVFGYLLRKRIATEERALGLR